PQTTPQNLAVAVPAASRATDAWGTEGFQPAQQFWARASGLRYREAPSSADDTAIIAETISGGEPLDITGRVQRPDGEWFRVMIDQDRIAYFKTSLATDDMSAIDSGAYDAVTDEYKAFTEIAPRVLAPAEGNAFAGGPQPVEISWGAPPSAVRFHV